MVTQCSTVDHRSLPDGRANQPFSPFGQHGLPHSHGLRWSDPLERVTRVRGSTRTGSAQTRSAVVHRRGSARSWATTTAIRSSSAPRSATRVVTSEPPAASVRAASPSHAAVGVVPSTGSSLRVDRPRWRNAVLAQLAAAGLADPVGGPCRRAALHDAGRAESFACYRFQHALRNDLGGRAAGVGGRQRHFQCIAMVDHFTHDAQFAQR